MMFEEIKKLVFTKTTIDHVNIIHSESADEVRMKWMSHKQSEIHIYHCIYSMIKIIIFL